VRFWILKGKWNELKYIPAGPPCNKGELRLPFFTVGWTSDNIPKKEAGL